MRTIQNIVHFNGKQMLATRPTAKPEDHQFVAVLDCLFHVFAVTHPIQGLFLQPQTKDAPHRGERDQLITDEIYRKGVFHHFTKQKVTSKVTDTKSACITLQKIVIGILTTIFRFL